MSDGDDYHWCDAVLGVVHCCKGKVEMSDNEYWEREARRLVHSLDNGAYVQDTAQRIKRAAEVARRNGCHARFMSAVRKESAGLDVSLTGPEWPGG